ncbi:DUF4157 domain-containing protein [Polaromonas sp. P2-4]|nr:DUF4157 domain-containing protein [Polaromonas sp. P2-4]
MEQRFGHDFSRVRVHTGGVAEQSTREVNANAYTVGHNVVFGAGQFSPGTNYGRRLLAHELTHVVQQSSSAGTRADSIHEQDTLPGVFHGANGALIQRDGENANSAGAFDVPTLDRLYNTAVQAARQTGNWQDAAEKLNGFNREDIQNRLAQLSLDEIAYLHLGALDNPRVGLDSQVAQLTKPGAPRVNNTTRSQERVRSLHLEHYAWSCGKYSQK